MIEDKTDGSILFSGSAKKPVWRFDPKSYQFQSIGYPSGSPMQMKFDNNGNIRYTLSNGGVGVLQELGHRSSHIYDSSESSLGEDSYPTGLDLKNNTLYVAKALEGKIAVFNITYSGGKVQNVTESSDLPQNQTLISPTDIIIANDSFWLTEHDTSFLTRYNIKTAEITRYPTALHPIQISTLPYWLAKDVNGTGVWFNEHRGNRIGFFDFATQTLTEFEVPTRDPQMGYTANALTIAADPTNENRAWFTELTENKIGFVDKSVPMPFTVNTQEKQVLIEKGKSATVNLEVSRNPKVKLFNNMLTFNVSSSISSSGQLVNSTVRFSQEHVDLSKVNGTQLLRLELKDEGIQAGQYTLAVSGTDGVITKTAYFNLIAK